jgi:hypothetical protein
MVAETVQLQLIYHCNKCADSIRITFEVGQVKHNLLNMNKNVNMKIAMFRDTRPSILCTDLCGCMFFELMVTRCCVSNKLVRPDIPQECNHNNYSN